MSTVASIRAHLDALEQQDANDPESICCLEAEIVEKWMREGSLSLAQILDVISAWLVAGFASRRLSFGFADAIANDFNVIAVNAALAPKTVVLKGGHSALSWKTFEAFDAGEGRRQPDVDPVESETKPLIADILERINELTEYPPALAGLNPSEPAATS